MKDSQQSEYSQTDRKKNPNANSESIHKNSDADIKDFFQSRLFYSLLIETNSDMLIFQVKYYFYAFFFFYP